MDHEDSSFSLTEADSSSTKLLGIQPVTQLGALISLSPSLLRSWPSSTDPFAAKSGAMTLFPILLKGVTDSLWGAISQPAGPSTALFQGHMADPPEVKNLKSTDEDQSSSFV